jgi:hypothetical protein
MHDLEITNAEFEEIMSLAGADSHVDATEQRMLSELQAMIALLDGRSWNLRSPSESWRLICANLPA